MNNNANFNPGMKGNKGSWKMEMVPMIASVAMEEGAAIYRVGDGTHTLSTDSTGNFKGILAQPITATDADYATSMKLKAVFVPRDQKAEAEFAVGAGTFTAADVGKSVKFNDSKGLAVDTAGTQAVITKYISSTRGLCRFNDSIS